MFGVVVEVQFYPLSNLAFSLITQHVNVYETKENPNCLPGVTKTEPSFGQDIRGLF